MFGLNTFTNSLSIHSILAFFGLCVVTFCIYDCIFALFRFIVSFFKKGGK